LLVLAALVLVARGWVWADLAAAVVVVAVIVIVGCRLIRQSFGVLADSAQLAPEDVIAACLRVEGIRAVHKVRSRGTPDSIKVDLHIQVDREMHVDRAHFLAHLAKRRIVEEFPGVDDVVVHIEPDKASSKKAK
jgi:cation diffusion facilitator family transporter